MQFPILGMHGLNIEKARYKSYLQRPCTICATDIMETYTLSAVWSPREWVSGYCTKWRLKGSFHSSYSRLLNVKTWPRNPILSLDTVSDTFVKCIFRNIRWAQGIWSWHSRSEIHWVKTSMTTNQWKWLKYTYFRGVPLHYYAQRFIRSNPLNIPSPAAACGHYHRAHGFELDDLVVPVENWYGMQPGRHAGRARDAGVDAVM